MAKQVRGMEDLDAAFELPDVVTDTKLRGLYEVLVARLRTEAQHLPMNTVQQLLIERIATNYIVLKAKEKGENGGFGSTAVQKSFNDFWLSMTSEFNRMLSRATPTVSPTAAANDRKAFLKDIQAIIVNTVSTVDDPRIRSEVLSKLALAFENAGI